MLGLVVCQPSEMVNHFFLAPPSPPAKPPDRDKLNDDWLGSSSLGEIDQPYNRDFVLATISNRGPVLHPISRMACPGLVA
jgi:hypothetical protein